VESGAVGRFEIQGREGFFSVRQHRVKAWWAALRALAVGVLATTAGRTRYCCACEARVLAFIPWRGGWSAAPPLMRALGIVGSDLDRFACPRCGCTDRDRHLRLYLERSELADRFAGARVLHFAPEKPLKDWISRRQPGMYVAADLNPAAPEVLKVPMESMPFADSAFDIVIANHVFEHVRSVEAAAAEVARVLNPRGFAILQTPWCKGLAKSIEDPCVTSPSARLAVYGQEDHARLFGRDVYERLSAGSLSASPRSHAEVLGDLDPDVFGVNPEEPLMLFRHRSQG
jgi:SAM-dependent methyltransferase